MEISGFLVALFGAASALSGTIVNALIQGRAQERRQRAESGENVRRWERERAAKREDEKREAEKELRKQAQECYLILSELLSLNTQTASYIESNSLNCAALDDHYRREILSRLHRVELLIACVEPGAQGLVRDLHGNANVRWGYLRQHIEAKAIRPVTESYHMDAYTKALEAGQKVEPIVKEIQRKLRLVEPELRPA